MPIRLEEYEHACLLGIDGDLAGENAAELRRIAQEQIESRQVADFIVDFEKCPFIDSEGLETLLWLKRRCEDVFGQLKLACLDDNCRKILEITRLDCRFEIHQEIAAALKMMR